MTLTQTTPSELEVNSCEVCGNTALHPVLDLGRHPLCDDLVPLGDPRVCREYPIDILFCDVCRTAHQRFQVPKRELFPPTYHYRSRFTADVLTGMQHLVASCQQRFGLLGGRKVLDIGCNDGSLLDFFRKEGAVTYGIEPTDAATDAERRQHRIYRAFLNEQVARTVLAEQGPPDFITFTNVFAHIEDLREVTASLKILMARDTVLVIENHYLGAVLDRHQFDTFYHEHPRTYSCTSFEFVARALDATLLAYEFTTRYGGNIRVFMRRPERGSAATSGVPAHESEFLRKFKSLSKSMKMWRESKAHILTELVRRHGKLRAKAFPGRAAILIKLLGLSEDTIVAVYEKPGSMKIGHYVPGTRIPIGSDDELFALADQSQPLLNLAWHISGEIHDYLRARGYAGPIIDIISDDDFKEAS